MGDKFEWMLKLIRGSNTDEELISLSDRVNKAFSEDKINEVEKHYLLTWINNRDNVINSKRLWGI